MWLYLAIASSVFLGVYDIAKKKSLQRNSVMWVLFSVSVLSTVLLTPFFRFPGTDVLLMLLPKAALVTLSWISGLIGMKLLPLTTVSTIKASRPVFVIVFSVLLFAERLNAWQWVGVVTALGALWMLSRSSRKEGIYFSRNRGIWWMGVSVVSGVCSALYDKYAISQTDPVSVLCWSNLFITVLMGAVLLVKSLREGAARVRFTPDWYLLLTAVLIVSADALYFWSLSGDGALLSVVSLIRRGAVIVTFTLSAILFKEGNIRSKAVDLAVMLLGMTILAIASQ